MTIELIITIIVSIFLLSILVTHSSYHYAIKNNLIDELGDERRNHSESTPRGGGLGIVVSFSVALIMIIMVADVYRTDVLVILSSGLFVGAVSFMDDHHTISPLYKFVAHCLAALIVLWGLSIPESFMMMENVVMSGWILLVLVFFGLICQINMYNFMDGIDSILSIEVISVCLSMFVLLFVFGDLFPTAYLLLILIAAVTGFLYFNLPKAIVFMGDIGSCYLGIIMAIMGLLLWIHNDSYLWVWLILQGVFVVDSGVTLLRRIVHREPISQPHSSHAYQLLFRRYGVQWVLGGILVINCVWLTLWAFLVMKQTVTPPVGLFIAYVPLILLVLHLGERRVR